MSLNPWIAFSKASIQPFFLIIHLCFLFTPLTDTHSNRYTLFFSPFHIAKISAKLASWLQFFLSITLSCFRLSQDCSPTFSHFVFIFQCFALICKSSERSDNWIKFSSTCFTTGDEFQENHFSDFFLAESIENATHLLEFHD